MSEHGGQRRSEELDTRGTMMIVYWEGACVVEGRRDDSEVIG